MTKSRFPRAVVEELLVKAGRRCCLCNEFKGGKVEVHHIVPKVERGGGTADNAIVLCFECHAEVHAYWKSNPKGRKFTAAELRRHRDQWFKKFSHGDLNGETIARITRIEEILEAHGLSAALTEVRERPPPPQAESAHPIPVPRAIHIGTEDLAKAKRPGMSLDAPGIVYVGETFLVTVNADPAPDVEIASFGSEVLFPDGLKWQQRETCEDEVVPRPANGNLGLCQAGLSTLLGGARHAVISNIDVPPLQPFDLAPGSTTPLVELDFVCNTPGSYTLTLTATPDSPDGAVFANVSATEIPVKTKDVDGQPVADAIVIECVERPA